MVAGLACLRATGAAKTIDERSRPRDRLNALRWADGLITSSGRNRGVAIATCGRPAAAYAADGAAGLVCLRCRDRACPPCQARRASELAERMVRMRSSFQGRWVFVTLTKRKMPARAEDADAAVSKVLDAWREVFNLKYASGRYIAALCEGGIRALEVTARARGEKNADGTSVRFFGWHAHLHALVRLREGVTLDDLREAVTSEWCRVVDADPRMQVFKVADDNLTRYICKYVVKPLGKKIGRGQGRELFGAIHGRRMLEGFGLFRSWKLYAPAVERDPMLIACHSLGELAGDAPPLYAVLQGWERTHPIPNSRGPKWCRVQRVYLVEPTRVMADLQRGHTTVWRLFDSLDDPPPFVWRAGRESPAALPEVDPCLVQIERESQRLLQATQEPEPRPA